MPRGPCRTHESRPHDSYESLSNRIARQYGLGDFNDYPERENWRQDLDECGDGLFHFLMVELADSEDCNSKAEALNRLSNASQDIAAATDAVSTLPDEEVH